MKRQHVIGVIGLALFAALIVFLAVKNSQYQSSVKPTFTSVPNQATNAYLDINATRAAGGTPTIPPGPNADQLLQTSIAVSQTWIAATEVTWTPTPTATASATRLASPTPGQNPATLAYLWNNQTLEAQGSPTVEPGLDNIQVAGTALVLTQTTATPRPTGTPPPTYTRIPPQPGFATLVYEQVQRMLNAIGQPTQPAVSSDYSVQAAAQQTVQAVLYGTPTPKK